MGASSSGYSELLTSPAGTTLRHMYASFLASAVERSRTWGTPDTSYAILKDQSIYEMVRRDAVVFACMEARKHAVASTEWGFSAVRETPEDAKAASVMEEIFEEVDDFDTARLKLAEADFTGSAYAKIAGQRVWRTFGDGVRRLWWVPTNLIDIDRRRVMGTLDLSDRQNPKWGLKIANPFDGAKWEEVKPEQRCWLVEHVYDDTEMSFGYGRGLIDALYHYIFAKAHCLVEGLQAVERWGQGRTILIIDPNRPGAVDKTNQELLDEAVQIFNKTMARHTGALLKGDEAQMLPGPGEGWQLIDKMLTRLDAGIARVILGSVMPSGGEAGDAGGSFARAKVEQDSSDTLVTFSQRTLCSSLNRSVVDLTWRLNRANFLAMRLGDVSRPRFTLQPARVPNPDSIVERAVKMLGANIPLKKTEVYKDTGFSQPGEDDEVIKGAADTQAEAAQQQQAQQEAALQPGEDGMENGDPGRFVGDGSEVQFDDDDDDDDEAAGGNQYGDISFDEDNQYGDISFDEDDGGGSPLERLKALKNLQMLRNRLVNSDDGEPDPFASYAWDESKHPRGQPENAGEFAENPTSGQPPAPPGPPAEAPKKKAANGIGIALARYLGTKKVLLSQFGTIQKHLDAFVADPSSANRKALVDAMNGDSFFTHARGTNPELAELHLALTKCRPPQRKPLVKEKVEEAKSLLDDPEYEGWNLYAADTGKTTERINKCAALYSKLTGGGEFRWDPKGKRMAPSEVHRVAKHTVLAVARVKALGYDVKGIHFDLTPAKEAKGGRADATCWFDEGVISVHQRGYRDPYAEYAKPDGNWREFNTQVPRLQCSIMHEMGHAIHLSNGGRSEKFNDRPFWIRTLEKQFPGERRSNGGSVPIWRGFSPAMVQNLEPLPLTQLSNYGRTNPMELVAETFTRICQGLPVHPVVQTVYDYFGGPRPLRKPS